MKKITQSNQTRGIEELLRDRAQRQGLQQGMADKEREKLMIPLRSC